MPDDNGFDFEKAADKLVEIFLSITALNASLLRGENNFTEAFYDYQCERDAFLLKEFETWGHTWCTRCNKIITRQEGTLIYLSGQEINQTPSTKLDNPVVNFYMLLRVCDSCKATLFKKRGRATCWLAPDKPIDLMTSAIEVKKPYPNDISSMVTTKNKPLSKETIPVPTSPPMKEIEDFLTRANYHGPIPPDIMQRFGCVQKEIEKKRGY